MSKLKDGEYKGRGLGHNGEIEVNVKVKNGKVNSINVLRQNEDTGIGGEAFSRLEDEIVKKQTYIVDAISGATNTSNGLKEAVKEAFDKALVKN